jgi:chemotaxis protein CheX
MPTDTTIEIQPDELAQIVESVFQTMLGLEVAECPTPWIPGEDQWISFVHLAGGWNGAVLLECGAGQACRFASRFLSMDPPASVDDVVRDVLGELANMIGGNLKCVLPPGMRLSMPSVVEGSDYRGPGVRDRLVFNCADGCFGITVLTTN